MRRWPIRLVGLFVFGLLLYLCWHWRKERDRSEELRMVGQASTMNRIQDLQNELLRLQGTRVGSVEVNPADGLRYVFLPAGRFIMGCSAGDAPCDLDENPAHEVEISNSYWIGQTEVTQSAFFRVSKWNPSVFKGADRPVENLDWEQAKTYCQAIGMRLPTEAEWEYAARAGGSTLPKVKLDQIAWYGQHQTQPVALKDANAWGLYDMLGNVWEWVADWYDPKYYAQSPMRDPLGPPAVTEKRRVGRGGAWSSVQQPVRVSNRAWGGLNGEGDSSTGFRCVGDWHH